MPSVVLSLFVTGLAVGMAVVLSSPHWVLAWMGLEINTLAILPLMVRQHHPRAVEAATKYFLIQVACSMAFLFAIISNTCLAGSWHIECRLPPVPAAAMAAGLVLKLGVAPLHVWLPEVLQGLDLKTGFIISTWQKIVPLLFLAKVQTSLPWPVLLITGLLSVLVGGWAAAVRGNVSKSLVYCSIAHMGWMVVALQITPALTLIVFIAHCLTSTCAFLIVTSKQGSIVNSLVVSWTNLPAIAVLMPLTLFSLARLPIFWELFPKWGLLFQLSKVGVCIASGAIALTSVYSFVMFLWLLHLTAPASSGDSPGSTICWQSPHILIPGLVALVAAGCLFFLPLSLLRVMLLNLSFHAA